MHTNVFPRKRVCEGDALGMERRAGDERRAFAVQPVTYKRAADMRHVYAQLVRAARARVQLA
jgi:hypothetical protein